MRFARGERSLLRRRHEGETHQQTAVVRVRRPESRCPSARDGRGREPGEKEKEGRLPGG